jgi:hypothetical protein
VPGRLKVKTIQGREKTLIEPRTVYNFSKHRSWKVQVKFKARKGVLD